MIKDSWLVKEKHVWMWMMVLGSLMLMVCVALPYDGQSAYADEGADFGEVVDESVFDGGVGTVDSPYQIRTAEQLNQVRNYLDKHFVQVGNIDLTEYVAEGGAGHNDGKGWEPIGSSNDGDAFVGEYNGKGYTISNLTINRGDQEQIGLFGYVDYGNNQAKIIGVGLLGVEIVGKNHVGALAGSVFNGDIKQCYVTGNVTGVGYRVGGLVGTNQRRITNCYSRAAVKGNSMVGGLVGGNVSSTAKIMNSYATGKVVRTSIDVPIGGLIGFHDSSNNSTWVDSYFDRDTSGLNDTKGISTTTEQMKRQETFSNWEFAIADDAHNHVWRLAGSIAGDIAWAVDGVINDGYPFLTVLHSYPPKSTNAMLQELIVYSVSEEQEGQEEQGEQEGQEEDKKLVELAFADGVFAYFLTVPANVHQVQVQVTAENENARVALNENPVARNQLSQEIAIGTEGTMLAIQVIAEDEETIQAYEVTITRLAEEPAPEPVEPEPADPTPEPKPAPPSDTNTSDGGNWVSEEVGAVPSGADLAAKKDDGRITDGSSWYAVVYDDALNFLRIDKEFDPLNILTDGTSTEVNLDELGILAMIPEHQIGTIISVSVADASGVVVTFSGETATWMTDKEIQLHVESSKTAYYFPLKELIGHEQVMAALLEEDRVLHIMIQEASALVSARENNFYEQLLNPTEFRVYIIGNGIDSVEINSFQAYVVRDLALLVGWVPEELATGVVLAGDGNLYPVPTSYYEVDGSWYARLQSTSNSLYGLLAKEDALGIDMQDHWAESYVNNLAVRKILQGYLIETRNEISADRYQNDHSNRKYYYYHPDQAVTGTEFTTMIARALGLQKPKELDNDNSYPEYQRQQLQEPMTRQQAAVVIEDAMQYIASRTASHYRVMNNPSVSHSTASNHKVEQVVVDPVDRGAVKFADWNQASDCSVEALQFCIDKQIIIGYEGKIYPQALLTRAEAAALIERMVKQSFRNGTHSGSLASNDA